MVSYVIHAFVTLLATVEPPALAPIFIALSAGMTESERRKTAIWAAGMAAAVIICFALFGARFLGVLGISLSAFRIAGGLLLFVIGYNMVFGRNEAHTAAPGDAAKTDDLQSVAIFPLAIPIIAGPGAISATIILAGKATSVAHEVGLIVSILGAVGVCFIVMLLAEKIDRILGATGRIVVSRLFGLILAALAMQIVADGVLAIAAGSGDGQS